MPRSIFNETLRRGWRSMIFWGIGIGLLGFVITTIIPNVGILKQFENLMNTMPALIKALGMDEAAQVATPEGFISAGYFGRVLLFVAIYSVLAGLNITANEEDQGILDVLLALPLPRWRLVVEKFAAYSLMLVGVVMLGFVGLTIGSMSAALQVDALKLLVGSINVLPSAVLVLAFTLFAGTFFKARNTAAAVTAVFIITSYMLDLIGSLASDSPLARLRSISFFSYYDNAHVMQTGLNLTYVMLLLGVTVILVVAGVWFFQRRDIGG
ncbi:MAG: ABC transporter permease subunit [Anaerolineae bacterium]|nr:ABC transporter permease subunit [Anaerolineae bacterium]